MPATTCFVSIGRNRFIGFEVQITLDGEPEFAAHGAKLGEADVAEFGAAHSEIDSIRIAGSKCVTV